jgi:hypothetical protein
LPVVSKCALERKLYFCYTVDHAVVMPNHIHLLLQINPDADGRPMAAPTISTAINQAKGIVPKKTGFSIWQKGFYDQSSAVNRIIGILGTILRETPVNGRKISFTSVQSNFILCNHRAVAFRLFKSLFAKIKTTLTGGAASKERRRDLFSFSPLAKIDVRLGLALGGNSPPGCCI